MAVDYLYIPALEVFSLFFLSINSRLSLLYENNNGNDDVCHTQDNEPYGLNSRASSLISH